MYLIKRVVIAKGLLKEVLISIAIIATAFWIVNKVPVAEINKLFPKALIAKVPSIGEYLILIVSLGTIMLVLRNIKAEWKGFRGAPPADQSCPVGYTPVMVNADAVGKTLRTVLRAASVPEMLIASSIPPNINRRQHRKRRMLKDIDELREGWVLCIPETIEGIGFGALSGLTPLTGNAHVAADALNNALTNRQAQPSHVSLLEQVKAVFTEDIDTQGRIIFNADSMSPDAMNAVVAHLVKRATDGIFMFAKPDDIRCNWLVLAIKAKVPTELLAPAWGSVPTTEPPFPTMNDFLEMKKACMTSEVLKKEVTEKLKKLSDI